LALELEQSDFAKQKARVDRISTRDEQHGRQVTVSDVTDDETLRAAGCSAGMLSVERAESYDTWIRVGWALRNTVTACCERMDRVLEEEQEVHRGQCDRYWRYMSAEANGLAFRPAWVGAAGQPARLQHARGRSGGRDLLKSFSWHPQRHRQAHAQHVQGGGFVLGAGVHDYYQFKNLMGATGRRTRCAPTLSTAVHEEIKHAVAQLAATMASESGRPEAAEREK
jgi:hypothetical protein